MKVAEDSFVTQREKFLDADSFSSWDQAVDYARWPNDYQIQLELAAERSGTDESISTGIGTVHGNPVVIIESNFRFLGGSIGDSAANRIVDAITRATHQRLPIVAFTSSGGTRLQEGTPAFVRMVDISEAIARHRSAGLFYLVHLGHPSTGGVLASWGSLGQVTTAEPGALVGFLGPKVNRALYGVTLPEGTQRAENLESRGLVDSVMGVRELRNQIRTLLETSGRANLVDTKPVAPLPGRVEPMQAILRTREADRISSQDILESTQGSFIGLKGSWTHRNSRPVIFGLTRFGHSLCAVIAQNRSGQQLNPIGPRDLVNCRSIMRLAEELQVPLISIIDTPGSPTTIDAEEDGIAGEIASCIATMSTLSVPRIAVLLGQGSGGLALTLFPADVIVALENAWLAPLPPEGWAAIQGLPESAAPSLIQSQSVTSSEMHEAGIGPMIILDESAPEGLRASVIDHITSQVLLLSGAAGSVPPLPND